MAQPARSIEPVHSVTLPSAAQVVAVGEVAVEWSASPARALHEQLLQSFGETAPSADERYPARVRLLIIGTAVLVPWLAIGGAWAALA